MRRNNRGAAAVGIVVAGAIVAVAVALLLWFRVPGARRAERRSHAAARAVKFALDRYAAANKGVYPKTGGINGDPESDALIRGKFINKYPENPYRPGKDMRNVNAPSFSPGDFYYARSTKKNFEYTLIVYAGTPRGGPKKNGVIFEHRPRQ